MTEEQIKYMVDRFLSWQLPVNFNPDAHIYFKPSDLQLCGAHPWPTGTNLLDAYQATNMIKHLIYGMPEVIDTEKSNPLEDVVLEDSAETPGVPKNIGPDVILRKSCRTIAIAILEMMRLRDLTVADLAKRIGVKETTLRHKINNLQDGVSEGMHFSTIALIFQACNCRINFELYPL